MLRKIWVILLGAAALAAPAHAGDPLAYRPGHDGALARAAAAGHSHVLYERSPDGVFATAARVARWRPLIERTASGSGQAPADRQSARTGLDLLGAPTGRSATRQLTGFR